MSTAVLRSRLHAIAADLNVRLDEKLTDVAMSADGTLYVSAMPDAFPTNDDERRLMQSALHAAILDSFAMDVPLEKLVVQVIAPPVVAKPPSTPCHASLWIQTQHHTINEFARITAHTMVESSYTRVLQAYPWRDIDNMLMRAVRLVEVFRTNLQFSVGTDPVLSNANVDALLPPIESLVNDFTTRVVVRDVTAFLGRSPTSLLETYEGVYAMCNSQHASLETMQLYTLLFKR